MNAATVAPVKIQGITTPRLWSWSKDYDRHVRRQAKSLAKGHGRNRRDNLEHRAVQYACWLAGRDGKAVPECRRGVAVAFERERVTDAKGETATAIKAVVWRLYGSGRSSPYSPEDVLLRVEIPGWDHDPEAPATERTTAEPLADQEDATMKRYVAYYRVSTDRQGESGLGLEAQRQAVTDYLAGNGAVVIEDFTEVESGKKADRPELAKALSACKKHRAILVIAKLDRLARNVHFVSGLLEAGVEFRCADMPEANKTMLQLWAVMAEWEREQISKRTKEALQAAKARGVKLGSPVPEKGSAVGVAAQKAQADRFAENVRPIIGEIQTAGVATLRGLAAALNARGIPTARGGTWGPSSVRNVLRRESKLLSPAHHR